MKLRSTRSYAPTWLIWTATSWAIALTFAIPCHGQRECRVTTVYVGRIIHPETGAPIPDQPIHLDWDCLPFSGDELVTTTRADGRFSFETTGLYYARDDTVYSRGACLQFVVPRTCGDTWVDYCHCWDNFTPTYCDPQRGIIDSITLGEWDIQVEGPPLRPTVFIPFPISETMRIAPGGSVILSDRSYSNALRWEWGASCGTISSHGPSVTYTAPLLDSGIVETCYVSVTASNSCGATMLDPPIAFTVGPTPGSGLMTVEPASLNFGIVSPGTIDSLPFRIHNSASFSDLWIQLSPRAEGVSPDCEQFVISNPVNETGAVDTVWLRVHPPDDRPIDIRYWIGSTGGSYRLPVTANLRLSEFVCLANQLLEPEDSCSSEQEWGFTDGNQNGLIDIGDLLVLLKHSAPISDSTTVAVPVDELEETTP